jgi:formate dehydrogenase (NADP+) alpha subunit
MAEKSGSFTNMEGRIQTFGPAVSPPGQARTDWEILADLARRMGHPEQYVSVEKIRQEIRQVVPMYAGLGSHRQAWIKNNDIDTPFSGNGEKFCFSSGTSGQKIKTDAAFPFTAFLAPPRFHLGSGTRTSRSERIRYFDGKPLTIQLSLSDYRSLGLENSQRIRVSSTVGAVEANVESSPALQSGQVMIPLAVNHNRAAVLAGLTNPDENDVYGWTVFRVGIEKISTEEIKT